MYESLKDHNTNFHLYVYAFNDLSFQILDELNLQNMTVISLKSFEDAELLKVKETRSIAEYCWTCTPSIILHAINNFNLDHCIYVDADLYFFKNPRPLIEEMNGKSILITEHRYTPKFDQTATSGKYCVQFMYFKNNNQGMMALKWWREKCLEWCYARFEDGKFGDQKYLDDWTDRFQGVHVLNHRGGGVAPWNVQQYKNPSDDLIFYHFHGFKYNPLELCNLSEYPISKKVVKQIYKPYVAKIAEVDQLLQSQFHNYIKHRELKTPTLLHQIKLYIKGNNNYYDIAQMLSEL